MIIKRAMLEIVGYMWTKAMNICGQKRLNKEHNVTSLSKKISMSQHHVAALHEEHSLV